MTNQNTYWDQCLEYLEKRVSSRDYEYWLKSLREVRILEKVYIVAPSDHFIELLNRKSILKKIQLAYKDMGKKFPEIISRDSKKAESLNLLKKDSVVSAVQEANTIVDKITKKSANKKSRRTVHSDYLFENFIEGKSNTLTLNAAKSLCQLGEEDTPIYNPFFIYGHAGNGKTHILHAIKNQLNNKGIREVCYQQASSFVTNLVTSIRSNKMERFKQSYRQYDVLLIDDVEFFVAKNTSMEEFFQLMNFFIENHRQIVLTSDTIPSELEMPDRIRSRLSAGLSTKISHPDFEHRVLTLTKKAELSGISLSQDVIYWIASRAKVSIRELNGLIKNLKANLDFGGKKEIDMLDVDRLLTPLLRHMNVMVTPDNIINAVTNYYGVRANDMTSKIRRRPVVQARHMAMILMRENTNLSLTDIGTYFCRDHSTVMHGIGKVKKEIQEELSIKQNFDNLTARLKNK